ncbi:MAG TPA: gamma carbonic anhydrase family protein [Azospirillaceae bacterium]|nr:gamma carbonic anhydrase family protein [Azospirillaceae bacterium]
MSGIILPYQGKMPKIHPSAFIAPTAVIIGDVEIGEDTGIWFGCVIRGDVNEIRIGACTNIQDGTVIHVASKGQGTYIGDGITVGHMALLHACTVESDSFIGMKACVMDGACVEAKAMVAAGALVTPGKRVKTGQLWAGNPAKFLRELREEELAYFPISAEHYAELGRNYK